MIHLIAATTLAVGAIQTDTTVNLARGKPVEVTPRPNYLPDAASQSPSVLTDGRIASGLMWLDRGTLGWIRPPSVTVTVDLGRRQRIGRIVYSTGAGSGNVRLPGSIVALVSDDRQNWRPMGDLMRETDADANPPTKYTPVRIDAKGLAGQGRYVRLLVTPEGAFAFCDEIEIYGGLREETAAPATGDVETLRRNTAIAGSVTRRRERARRTLANAVESAPGGSRPALRSRLPSAAAVRAGAGALGFPAPADLKLGQAAAAVWRAKGVTGVRAWRRHRFDPVDVHETPSGTASVSIEALQGEKRSDAILVSSALSQSADVSVSLQGISPTGLSIAASPWMDTRDGGLVAVALPWQAAKASGTRIRVHPGVTTRLWFRLDGGVRGAGNQNGKIVLKWPGGSASVPARLYVSSARVPKPQISLGLLDYAEGKGAFDMRASAIPVAVREMKAHAVNSPWAQREILPWPEASAFDRSGRLTRPLSTSRLVAWAKKWPEAPTLMVFANVRSTFAGASPGTPAFRSRVATWARTLAGQLNTAGIRPGRVTLLLVDEPSTDAQARLIEAYAHAIRAGTRDIRTMVDPFWKDDTTPAAVAARESVDIVCELVERVLEKPSRARVRPGQTFWLYQTQPHPRTLDPSQYYRLLPWLALRYGAKGVMFWSLADNGGVRTPLAELDAPRPVYSPALWNGDRLVDTVQWQAMMEGVEDHEVMTSLRQAAKTAAQRSEAEALIDEAVDAVLRNYRSGDVRWGERRDRSVPDRYRVRAMRLLERWAGR